jgi:hypothetical protein
MKMLMTVMAAMIWLGAVGCAEQKAAPAPSQRQIQADSDRFFDKMKQDEHDHGTVPEKKGAGDGGY